MRTSVRRERELAALRGVGHDWSTKASGFVGSPSTRVITSSIGKETRRSERHAGGENIGARTPGTSRPFVMVEMPLDREHRSLSITRAREHAAEAAFAKRDLKLWFEFGALLWKKRPIASDDKPRRSRRLASRARRASEPTP